MTIVILLDPRIPAVPVRSMSGFHRPGKHGVHQALSAVRCSPSRVSCILPRTTCEADFRTMCIVCRISDVAAKNEGSVCD